MEPIEFDGKPFDSSSYSLKDHQSKARMLTESAHSIVAANPEGYSLKEPFPPSLTVCSFWP